MGEAEDGKHGRHLRLLEKTKSPSRIQTMEKVDLRKEAHQPDPTTRKEKKTENKKETHPTAIHPGKGGCQGGGTIEDEGLAAENKGLNLTQFWRRQGFHRL